MAIILGLLAASACDRAPQPEADRGISREQARDRREAALETAVARADMKAKAFEDRFDKLDAEIGKLDGQIGQVRRDSVSQAQLSSELRRLRESLPAAGDATAAMTPQHRR